MIEKVKNTFSSKENAVSPVIATVMMVAVTLILAALVQTQAISIVQSSTQDPVNIGMKYDQSYDDNSDTYSLYIAVSSMYNGDKVVVNPPNGGQITLNNVGDSTQLTGLEEGQRVQIIGYNNGNQQLLRSYTIGYN